jgi:ectoine hydroxylase-related dioxygenase (phytanoyl-CoA dioxygenase family)
MLETPSVTAWIPFATATRSSGSLAFLPGTQQLGLRKFVNIFLGDPEDILDRPEVRGVAPVFMEVPKGSVSFHHGLMLHFAIGNTTGRDRAVHTIIYFAHGNTRGYPTPHFAVDRAAIAVGEPIRSDVTPIAWPRPSGDLPPTPPPWNVDPLPVTNPGAVPVNRG